MPKKVKRANIIVDQDLAKSLSGKYFDAILRGDGNGQVIDEVLGKDADPKEDKLPVAKHLRDMAIMAIKAINAGVDPEKSRQEIGAYLARLKQASDAKKYFKEALEDVENFKSAILKSELNPGKVTADSLRQVARQSIDSIEIDDGLDKLRVPTGRVTPFPGEFGFKVDLEVAQEVAEIAKGKGKDFVFTRPPSQGNRNAVMDSVPILKREARLSEAEFRKALLGEELSETQIKAIKKASPVNSGKTRNSLEWAGYNAYKILSKNLAPGIFKSHASEGPLYNKYLELRDEMISKNRGYLSSEELRRYLTGLRNQRNEFATHGNVSQTDLRALDALIAETEVAVVKANTDDMNKFVETLNKINDSALSGMQGLLDEEAAMWKFRMLQLALVASPFGLMNLMGPVAGILEPIFSGNLQFGEGLAQGISNIPFFGDIADALKLTDFIELLFDKTPLLSDVTGLINQVTDCASAQELLGAAQEHATHILHAHRPVFTFCRASIHFILFCFIHL